MPNWVKTKVRLRNGSAEEYRALEKKYATEGCLDFDKIIPQPKTIEECPEEFLIRNEEEARKANLAYEGDKKWLNWYQWNLAHWGTKWNAHNGQWYEDDEFEFEAAWSAALPVLVELSRQNPKLIIEMKYADEIIGTNCGRFTIKGGEIISGRVYREYNENARRFAERVWE